MYIIKYMSIYICAYIYVYIYIYIYICINIYIYIYIYCTNVRQLLDIVKNRTTKTLNYNIMSVCFIIFRYANVHAYYLQ